MKNQKRTIYLHIGLMKTGTSALQSFLYNNKTLLSNKGLYYPWLEIEPENKKVMHGNLSYFFMINAQSKAIPKKIFTCNTNEAQDIYKKQCEERLFPHIPASAKRIILSSEIMSSYARPTLPLFYRLLNDYGFEVKLLVYIRPMVEWITSVWAEVVKEKNFHSPDLHTYLLKDHNSIQEIINLIEEFGKENVIVRPYEKVQWKNNNLFDDMLDIFEIPLTDEFDTAHDNRKNITLGRKMTELLRIMPTISQQNYVHTYNKMLGIKNDSKIVDTLSDDEMLAIMDKYRDAEKTLAKMYDKESFFINSAPFHYAKQRSHCEDKSFTFTENELSILREALHNAEEEQIKKDAKNAHEYEKLLQTLKEKNSVISQQNNRIQTLESKIQKLITLLESKSKQV